MKAVLNKMTKKKTNLHYTCVITPNRVTQFRGLASGQHSSEKTSRRWRAVGDTVPDLTDPGFEPQVSRTDSKPNDIATKMKITFFRKRKYYSQI